MQKLKIVNCLGECIEFGMHAPFLLSHVEGLGIPTVEVYETQAVDTDGSEVHDLLLADRLISSRVTIVCDTREELYKKRRQVMRLLNPKLYNPITKKRGELTLYYTNDHKTYRAFAYSDSSPDFKERIGHCGIADVTLTCSNPYFLDEEDTTRKLKYFEGGLAFPITFATKFAEAGYSKIINNIGDVEVPVILEYIGAAENPIITNETTGEFIKVNRILEEGQKLVINTAEGEETVDIVSSDGTKTNVFNWIDPLTTFFKLVQGENKITYSADNEMNQDVIVNVVYTNKYVGV